MTANMNYAFLCERCGAIYDRVPGTGTRWAASTGICSSCAQSPLDWTCPGSVLRYFDHPYVKALPTSIIERELNLHLAWVGGWDFVISKLQDSLK